MPMPSLPETEVKPLPALERRSRRKFSADDKMRILSSAEACRHGELGALLRREGVYSSQLKQWRRDFVNAGLGGLGKTAPGPTPARTPEQRRIAELERINARLTRQLEVAEGCITLQKKVWAMLDQQNSERGA
jgi:transposase